MVEISNNVLEVGTNLMELIDFRIKKKNSQGDLIENIYGINVFKVREVIFKPKTLYKVPTSFEYLEGMINLRGKAIPIINLAKRLGYHDDEISSDYLIITEFNNIICGFMVHEIKKILRFSWEDITPPPEEITKEYGNLITAVTLLDNNNIMLIIDLETIISEINTQFNFDDEVDSEIIEENSINKTVLIIDDSNVARKLSRIALEKAGYIVLEAGNGQAGLTLVTDMLKQAKNINKKIIDLINVIVCDIEMPVMDGFTFTKNMKDNNELSHVPIILHTSLNGSTIKQKGDSVGAEDFIVKFNPDTLLESVEKQL